MKICVISYSKTIHAAKRLIEEGEKLGHEMYLTTWEDIYVDIRSEKIYFGDKNKPMIYFDAIIPRSDRYKIEVDGELVTRHLDTVFRLMIEQAKTNNIFFLNSTYFSHYQSIDKIAQQFFLAKNNLPGIGTYFFTSLNKLSDINNIIRFPIVSKIAQGSTGKSVFKLENKTELEDFIKERNQDGQLFLFQDYHPISCDFRILIVGKQVLGIMKRTAQKGEWRTNFSLGGNVEKCASNEKMEKIALETATKMGLDYVGIDMLESNGEFYIIETNSLPQFKGFEKAFPNVNVAKKLIALVEKKTAEGKLRSH